MLGDLTVTEQRFAVNRDVMWVRAKHHASRVLAIFGHDVETTKTFVRHDKAIPVPLYIVW